MATNLKLQPCSFFQGPKVKAKKERDFIGIDLKSSNDKSTGQLCFWSSEADIGEDMCLKRAVLSEHPNIKIFTDLLDAHFYIFEKWVVDYIAHDESFSALKGEVLPKLVKKQFTKLNVKNSSDTEEDKLEFISNKAERLGFESFVKIDAMDEQKRQLSSWNDHIGNLKGTYHNRMLRCYAFVRDGGTCLRSNTMHGYWHLNQQIGSLLPSLSHNQIGLQIHPNANVQAKAQLGLECFVGENSVIAEKTTIKNCIIGSNCKISEKVRLTNCVIMNNVTIQSLNNISGSIICDDVETSTYCEIKDCIVRKGHKFSKDGGKKILF